MLMKKNVVLLASLAFLGTVATTVAAVILSNDNSFLTRAIDSRTNGHTIVFKTGDIVNHINGRGYAGFTCTKEHATKSGASFWIEAGLDGKGIIESQRDDCLLYCETTKENEANPTNTFEMCFTLREVASFENVVIRGTLYTNKEKTETIDSYTFVYGDGYCTYNAENGDVDVTGKGFFKAYITTIEISYTCPVF